MTWWCDSSDKNFYDAIICDGAVRSGKTVCMSLSFIAWSFYAFSDTSFAIFKFNFGFPRFFNEA